MSTIKTTDGPGYIGRMMDDQELRQHRINERRLKRYIVDPTCLLDFLRSMEHWPEYFTKAIIPGLPDGATLQDVRYDDCRGCLSVLVHHPSFEPCPDGGEIAIADGYHQATNIVLRRQADGSYRPLETVQAMVADFYGSQIKADIIKSGELLTTDPSARTEHPPYQELPGGSIRIADQSQWPIGIGPELKARLEQCTEIVDQTPQESDSREWFSEQMRRTD